MVVDKAQFAHKGIIGACTCGGSCDIVGSGNLLVGTRFAVSCLHCRQTWKSAGHIEEAVDNFSNDLLEVVF